MPYFQRFVFVFCSYKKPCRIWLLLSKFSPTTWFPTMWFSPMWLLFTLENKDWLGKKVTIYFPILYLVKSSENIFFFYLHFTKPPKSFEKIAILKIWQLVFFLDFKTYFGILQLIFNCISHLGSFLICHSY